MSRLALRACLTLAFFSVSIKSVEAQHTETTASRTTDGNSAAARRFRFAELLLGLDAIALGGASGGVPLPDRVAPRVLIGGLHFWGHADFAVLFPVTSGVNERNGQRSLWSPGIETRARYYPKPLNRANWTPYVGAALGAVDVQIDDGPRLDQFRPVWQIGVAARLAHTMVEVGWSARPGPSFAYPLSRAQSVPLTPGVHSWTVGVHRTFETTAGALPRVQSGAERAREQRWRAAGRLSGPSVGLGATALMLVGNTHYNSTQRPWLAQRPRSSPSLDVGLGWYDDKRDAHANVAWRRGRFVSAAYDFEQINTRESLAIELFKFVGDYHGFAPFIGPSMSVERLRVKETDGGITRTDRARTQVAPGVLFGWDIRPTRTERLLLRTNLRWFPRLNVPLPGGTQALDQFEFNFIQAVWYPRRRG